MTVSRKAMYLQKFTKFILPLIVTVNVKNASMQVVLAGISRGKDPTSTLGAFGVASYIVMFLASPLLQVKTLVLVMAKGRHNAMVTTRFVSTMALGSFFVLISISLTPLGGFLTRTVYHLPDEETEEKVLQLLLLLCLHPVLEAVSHFQTGLLMQAKTTSVMATASITQVLIVSVSVLFMLWADLEVINNYPVLLPAISHNLGGITKALLLTTHARVSLQHAEGEKHVAAVLGDSQNVGRTETLEKGSLEVRHMLPCDRESRNVDVEANGEQQQQQQQACSDASDSNCESTSTIIAATAASGAGGGSGEEATYARDDDTVTMRQLFLFFWPLAFVMMLQGASRPLINLFVSQSDDDAESIKSALAVLTVVFPLSHIFYGWVNEVRSLLPSFCSEGRNNSEDDPEWGDDDMRQGVNRTVLSYLRTFAILTALFSCSLLLGFTFSPLSRWFLLDVLSVPADIVPRCETALIPFSLFPFVVATRGFLHGYASATKQTVLLAPSGISRLVSLVSVMCLCTWFGVPIVMVGVLGLFSAFLGETLTVVFMLWRSEQRATSATYDIVQRSDEEN